MVSAPRTAANLAPLRPPPIDGPPLFRLPGPLRTLDDPPPLQRAHRTELPSLQHLSGEGRDTMGSADQAFHMSTLSALVRPPTELVKSFCDQQPPESFFN